MGDDGQLLSWLERLCTAEAELPPVVRGRLLSRLIACIQRSPQLWDDTHQDHAMALNQTLEWLQHHICEFQPDGGAVLDGLVRWVNGHLKWRVQDLKGRRNLGPDRADRDYCRVLRLGLGAPMELDRPLLDDQGRSTTQEPLIGDPSSGRHTLLEQWIEQLQAEKQQRLGQRVRAYLEADPDGVLGACRTKKYPDCHCRGLVQGLYLSEPPSTRRAIAQRLAVNEQTLHSHWQKKCLPLLQIIALRHDPQVREYLQGSPDRAFSQCHLEGAAACTCLELSRRLLLSEGLRPLRAIAKDLQVSETALVAHWQTHCLPHLKRHRL